MENKRDSILLLWNQCPCFSGVHSDWIITISREENLHAVCTWVWVFFKRPQSSEVLNLESTSALVSVRVFTGIIIPLDQGLSQMFSFFSFAIKYSSKSSRSTSEKWSLTKAPGAHTPVSPCCSSGDSWSVLTAGWVRGVVLCQGVCACLHPCASSTRTTTSKEQFWGFF